MRCLDLFSGIGGFALGLESVGMHTVGFCEIEPFPRAVLAHHWPGVPIHDDVRTLSAESVPWLRAEAARGIDLICGGFPCQDISVAGKGAGLSGARSGLWSECSRLVGELRPRWALFENVGALKQRGIDKVCADLEGHGYTVWPLLVGAGVGVGAPHRRERIWIIARMADCYRRGSAECGRGEGVRVDRHLLQETRRQEAPDGPNAIGAALCRYCTNFFSRFRCSAESHGECDCPKCQGFCECDERGEAVGQADRYERGSQGERDTQVWHDADGRGERSVGDTDAGSAKLESPERRGVPQFADGAANWPARPGEPQWEWEEPRLAQFQVGCDLDGLPLRLARRANRESLKALGNSVVPQVVAIIGKAILEADEALR